MTVMDVIRKYDLSDFSVVYENQYGNLCNCTLAEMGKFMSNKVKGININFPTSSCTIAIIEEGK